MIILLLVFVCILPALLLKATINASELRSEIKQKEQSIISLENTLTSKEQTITDLQTKLNLQEQRLKSVDARTQWVSQVLRDVEIREHDLEQRERLVNSSLLADRERALVLREHALEETIVHRVNKEVVKAIGNKEKVLAEREQIVTRRSRNLAIRQESFNEKSALLDKREKELQTLRSNITALPYMAAIIADYDTRGLEIIAQKLDWGFNQERLKKVASIRTLRAETQKVLAQYKEAEYQLAYAVKMFPALEDFLETDYSQLPSVDFTDLSAENHDNVRSFLSDDEYAQLSVTQRNQLALDRYLTSHRRTNWQIGRDYENYVGYVYTNRGYAVEYYGSLHGLEDLGRDLIATHPDRPTLIIQCKYWSSKKIIHEKHINQLYGTLVCYCFEKGLSQDEAKGMLITNITISETARKFAEYLGVEVVEQFPLKQYPCIKCNINTDEHGNQTKIYHLPFDQQYDTCKIDKPGEFFAMTVAEAEAAGFRRAFKWYN